MLNFNDYMSFGPEVSQVASQPLTIFVMTLYSSFMEKDFLNRELNDELDSGSHLSC